jgi:alpha/beta superfamily hydrolase
MNSRTERATVTGPVGELACALDAPVDAIAPRGLAVVCHPHPLHGGTMNNKVVQTLARAFVQAGWRSVRFDFRGVGESAGHWDGGVGEIDDALAVVRAFRTSGQPLALAGFSFGAYVASQVAARLADQAPAERVILVGPAVQNFEVAPLPPASLVVHGEADDVVPLAAVLDWARPQVQPVVVVPATGHFFHGQLALLKSLVLGALAPQPE